MTFSENEFIEGQSNSQPNKVLYIFIFLFLFILTQLPIYLVEIPAMVDYPNHFARMFILENLNDSEFLSKYYMEKHLLIPNLAMETIIPTFSKFISLPLSTKLFISLGLLLISSGVTALYFALHRSFSWWTLVIFLFLLSHYLIWGFLGYFFSIGCALWIAALWIIFRQKRYWIRLLFFSISASLLYLFHLMAFGIYMLFILGYEFGGIQRKKGRSKKLFVTDAVISMGQFVPGGLLFLLKPKIVNPNLSSDFASLYSLYSKVGGILGTTWNYSPKTDIALFGLFFGTVFFLLITKRLIIHPALKWPLIMMTVVFILLPNNLSGSSYLDKRIPIVILYFLIASISFKEGIMTRGKKVAAVILIFMILLFRTSILYKKWVIANDYYAGCIRAFDLIPRGARIYTATKSVGEHAEFPPARHIASYAVIRREAFVQNLFTFPRYGESIAYAEEFEKIVRAEPRHMYTKSQTPNWGTIVNHYDYVFLVNPQLFQPIPDQLNEIIEGKGFSLYLIKRE